MGVTVGIRAGRILGLAMKCDKCVFPFHMCRVSIGLGCYSYSIEPDQLNPICMTFKNMGDRRRNSRGRGGRRPTVNPSGGADGVPWPQIMEQIQQQQNQFMGLMMQNLRGDGNSPVVVPEVVSGTFKDLIRMNPPEFHGGMDPMKAHVWAESMERIFMVMQCREENKVMFASHKLKGTAMSWWVNASALMTIQGVPKEWSSFKAMILEKYFPGSGRTREELELRSLRQGSRTVAWYAGEFEELFNCSLQAEYAPVEEWKIGKFLAGVES